MRLLKLKWMVAALPLALAGIVGTAGGVAADGYGNGHGNVQLYQATVSANCNNASLCGTELGGFLAWAVFNQDGTFEATVTGCGHVTGPCGGGGAIHFDVDGHYQIIDFWLGPWIVITDEVDTAAGSGTVITIPSEFEPVGPAAKTPATDLAQMIFGFSGPGVNFIITVTPMHTA